jgi:predicted LPLAT superfamily acyltransferase
MKSPEDTAKIDSRRQWSSRSLGTRLGYNIFFAIIRIGGRRLAYFAQYWVALYYVLCRPSVRRRSDPYLSHRFPNAGWSKRYLDCYRMFTQMGKILLDRTIVGMLGLQKMTLTIDGREELLKLVDKGFGFILLMSHVGCWQVAVSALHFLNVPVNLLLEKETGNIDQQYFEHADMGCPFRIIDPSGYLGGALEMLDALKKAEVLCMMGDRVLGSDKSYIRVNFLGEAALFPFSAFMIASAASVPVVIFFSYKTGYNSYALRAAKIIRIPNNLGRSAESYRPYVEQFVKELEIFTENYPYQFFNFYDMWGHMERSQ